MRSVVLFISGATCENCPPHHHGGRGKILKIRDRVKEFRRVPASSLLPNPKNWRTHSEAQLDALRGVLAEIGFAGAELVFETADGELMLVDGHARAEVVGESEVPVLVLDVTPEEADKLLATFDPLGAMAGADSVKLDQLLREVQTGSQALADMLTDLAESNPVVNEFDEEDVVEDEPPSVPAEPETQPGDLWILGDHRLVCGDCTDQKVMVKLFGDLAADMLFTDPPYNVAYVGKTKDALTIDNDEMSGEDFLAFLEAVFTSLSHHIKPGSASYICHADSEGMRFRKAFSECGFEMKQCLVWVKNSMVMGRQDYHWKHEPILYGWRSGAGHRFYANRKQTTVIESGDGVTIEAGEDGRQVMSINVNGRVMVVAAEKFDLLLDGDDELETVWRIDRPSRNAEHPTMKPVRLCARAISHGSKKGEIVLDAFLGSGSTLIAAEQMGRRCFGTELSPAYCDVIVRRWEVLTGKEAKLERS